MNDERVLDFLRHRRDVEPPLDLVDSMMGAVADAPQQRATRFAVVVPAAAAAVMAAVIAVALLVNQPPAIGPSPSIASSPSSSPSASHTPSPAASSDALPAPEAASYVERDGFPFTIIESDEADALFAEVDTCTSTAGWTVSFPDSWYTNPAIGSVPACSWFSPTSFAVDDPGLVPDEIAIHLETFIGGVGQIPEYPRTLSETISLSGIDGYRTEDTIPDDPPAFHYAYGAWLDTDYLGRKFGARTSTGHGGAYALNRAVLDRMMATLELAELAPAADSFTPDSHAEADALFIDANVCVNAADGYRVEFPNRWYTNQPGDPAAADAGAECAHFLPEPIAEGVLSAILGERTPGSTATFDDEISRQNHTIAGRPAVRMEFRAALGDPPPDRRELVWRVQLTGESDGPHLVFRTSTDDARDYELNKAVLDRMMLSLQIVTVGTEP